MIKYRFPISVPRINLFEWYRSRQFFFLFSRDNTFDDSKMKFRRDGRFEDEGETKIIGVVAIVPL